MARPRTFDEAEVLAKARDQFWLNGYTATSISDLERATGLQRTSLYAAFGDKRTLFAQVLNHYQEDNLDYLRELAASAKTWRACTDRLFREAVERLSAERPCRGCLVVNTTAELAAVDTAAGAFVSDNRRRFVEAILPVAEREPSLSMPPRAACDYVFTLYSGLATFAKSGVSRGELEAVVRAGLRVFA